MARELFPLAPRQISDPPSHGAESNLSGQFLEHAIEREFLVRGVVAHRFSKRGNHPDLLNDHCLIKHFPYQSIYGSKSYSEFVYRHFPTDLSIRIECRWQESAGSVDEKMPYLLLNARDAMPEREVWLVIAGDGARDRAVNWLRNAASRTESKVIQVFDLTTVRKAIKALLSRSGQRPRQNGSNNGGSLFQ